MNIKTSGKYSGCAQKNKQNKRIQHENNQNKHKIKPIHSISVRYCNHLHIVHLI